MRRILIWALAATAATSIGAIWTEETPHVVEAVSQRGQSSTVMLEKDQLLTAAPALAAAPGRLPPDLPAVRLEPAKRDLFVPYSSPPPPVQPASPVVVQEVQTTVPLIPPPVQAPAINLRFLGTMVTPTGQRLIYLARGEVVVPVSVGDRLDEGYTVTALAADAVTLTFPPSDARVIVPISQPSQQ